MAMDVSSLIKQPGAGSSSPGIGAAAARPMTFNQVGRSLGQPLQQAAVATTQAAQAPQFNAALSAYTAAAAPDYMQNALNRAATVRSGEYAGASIGLNRDALNLKYQSDLGDLNTNIGQNAIALAAAQRQPGVLDQLTGIQHAMFGNQRDILGEQTGEATRSQRSQAAGMGATVTEGNRQAYRDIYTNLANQMQGIGLNEQQFDVNDTENKAQAQDRIKTLGLEANNLGMKPEQLESMLKNQLSQMGLDQSKAYGDLLDGLKSNDIDSYKLYQSILNNARASMGG